MSDGELVLHLFLISTRVGETAVFLIEVTEGLVEFPRITATEKLLDDEPELVRLIRVATGMEVAISGFLTPPVTAEAPHADSNKFLIGRVVSGTPHPAAEHVGWEWRAGSNLLALEFLPKSMVNELRVFMNT